MITKEAGKRMQILEFWVRFGLEAAMAAYKVKRSTLYGWRRILREKGLTAMSPKSQAPHRRRKRVVESKIIAEIRRLRTDVCPNMGKAKVKSFLDKFCEAEGLALISESKIGRIIKEKKIYHHRQKVSHSGRITVVKKQKKARKPRGLEINLPGELVEIDTIVRFIWKVKRYIITAVDIHGRVAFAWCYRRPTSANARDFMIKLQTALPFAVKAVQTDNGSEFHKYFAEYLNEQNITHYWNYPGKPFRQGHVEKFNRTAQEEFVDWHERYLEEPLEFNRKLTDWLIWYNTERPHWSLRLQSPIQFLINNGHLSNMLWTDTFR
jgi:transposase InsO family protein